MAFKDQYSKGIYKIDKISNQNLDLDTVLETLQFFGHLITKLKIDYSFFDLNEDEMINKCVNKYLSNSLIQIELDYCSDDTLAGLTGPFSKVETAVLRHGYIRSKNINFQSMFPVVWSLDLMQMGEVRSSTLKYHFQNLQHMTVEPLMLWPGANHYRAFNALQKRLALNPQLRHITFAGCNMQVLKIVSETLPNIERIDALHFSSDDYESGDIHLPNLKVFELRMGWRQPSLTRIPLVFRSLEEIVCGRPANLWLDIIVQNKNLKKIEYGELNHEQLQRIADELKNLEEFTSYCEAKTKESAEILVQFMVKAKKLKKATFKNSSVEIRNEILSRLSPEWTIVTENGESTFIRN